MSEDVYEFSEDFQLKVAALKMRHLQFAKKTKALIEPQYFEDPAVGCLIEMANRHYEVYESVLSDTSVLKEELHAAIKSQRIPKNMVDEVKDVVKKIYRSGLEDHDYYADQVSKFAQQSAVRDAIEKSVDLHERGETDKILELFEKASKVGKSINVEAYDFFEKAQDRFQRRVDVAEGKIKPNGIPTGIRQFDNLLHHKGLGIKELTVFMAGAKRGKTMAIWDFAQRVALQGYNVVGVSLEVSKQIIADRIDSNISGVPMAELSKKMGMALSEIKGIKDRAGKLDIYEFPASTFRPMDLERIVDDYESRGEKIDLLVVDYLDIMAPDRWMNDKQENSKNIWTAVRDIGKVHDLAVLSATQTNREGMKRTVADDTDVSDDINKIRIADLVISINATEDELAAGESRLFFAASRNQRGKMTVRVKNDLECQRFITEVLEIM